MELSLCAQVLLLPPWRSRKSFPDREDFTGGVCHREHAAGEGQSALVHTVKDINTGTNSSGQCVGAPDGAVLNDVDDVCRGSAA